MRIRVCTGGSGGHASSPASPPSPSSLPCRALEPLTFPVLARSLNRANMARLNAFPPLLPSSLSGWRPTWQVCLLARSLVAVAMQTPLSVVEVEGSAQDRGRTAPWDNVLGGKDLSLTAKLHDTEEATCRIHTQCPHDLLLLVGKHLLPCRHVRGSPLPIA